MKTIPVFFMLHLLLKEGSGAINPCPHIIEFKSDSNEDFAIITILAPKVKSGLNLLKVKLEIRGDPTRGDNELKLVKSKKEVVADVNNGKSIQFKLNFLQSRLLPSITIISLNGKDICRGVEGFGQHKFDIQTTFTLPPLSTPTPSTTSQLLSANTSSVQPHDAAWLQSLPFSGICGRSFQLTHTIIGGAEVAPGEYPWMVALYHYLPEPQGAKKHKCGASLISDMYVITAAHCTQKQTQVHLEFGKYNIDKDFETQSVFRTSWKMFSLPDFNNSSHDNVALVSFHPPLVTFTQWIVPICLWGNFDSELHRGTIAGWGQQDNNNTSPSTTPKQLTISMVESNMCRNSHFLLQKIATNKTFCAGGNGAGPCHGDSGGGFFVTYNDVQHLRGIISHSLGDAERCNVYEYAVYADLAYALDWIQPYLTGPAAVSIATQKCEEYKQLKANIDKSLPEGNIVTSVSQYPHMALLGSENPPKWFCTGALISEQFILTTALCLKRYAYGNVSTAHLGFLDKGNRNKSGTLQEFKIIQTYKHPTRNRPKNYADIGLLKLDRPVEYTKGVVPACLHEDVNIPTNDVQEIGWNDFGADSDLLQLTNQTPSNNIECASAYGLNVLYPKGIDADTQFCVDNEGRSCDDELVWSRYGKPLQIHDASGAPKIIGILSSDQICSRPALYTRVSYYVPWIESIVWPGASGY